MPLTYLDNGLAIAAVVLAGVELVRSKGQNLLAWAVVLLALAVTTLF